MKWCYLLLENDVPWTVSEPYSPAWILKESCLHHKANSSIWLVWAQLESQYCGPGDYETEDSARWIFKESCINHNTVSSFWLAWTFLESTQNRIGDYETENSARWIFQEACLKYEAHSSVWLAWAHLEIDQDNTGTYETEYSAKWIFQNACFNYQGDSSVWLAWARLEAEQNNIGTYETEYSAQWIFLNACLNHQGDGSVWMAWAHLEEQQNNVGTCETEHSARWIYAEGIRRFPDNLDFRSAYTTMELSFGSIYTARKILRQAFQTNDIFIGKLAIIEFFCNTFYTEEPFCMIRLLTQMEEKKPYSTYVLLHLYYCFTLLGQEEKAQEYHSQLSQTFSDYDLIDTTVREFIQLCRDSVHNQDKT